MSARPTEPGSGLVTATAGSRRPHVENSLWSADASGLPAREVLDAIGQGILIHSLDGVIAISNVAADRILGLPAGGAVGIDSGSARWRAIREDGSPLAREDFPSVATLVTGEPRRNVVIGVHAAGGGLRWISMDSEMLRHEENGPPYAVITTLTDVTELRASEVARALASEQLHERAARAAHLTRVYATLSKATEAIGRIPERAPLYEEVCRVVVEHGGLAMAWVGEIDESGWVIPIARAGNGDGYVDGIRISVRDIPEGHGPVGTAAREGREFAVKDVATDPGMVPWRERALARGYHSAAAFPLVAEGKTFGVLSVYAGQPDFFDEEEVELFADLAANLGFAIEAQQHEQARRRSERGLRDAEHRFRTSLETLIDPFLLLRPLRDAHSKVVEFEVEFANEAAYAARPGGHRELVGRLLSEILVTHSAVQMIDEFARVAETGEPLVRNEHPYEASSGGLRYFDVRVSQAGELLAYTWRDVTDRYRAEERIRASEERLAEAQRIAHVGSWEWDIPADQVSWSDEVGRLLGIGGALSAVPRRTFLDTVHPDDREAYEQAVAHTIDTRTPYSFEYRAVLPGGDCRVLQARGEPVCDELARPIRIIGSIQDITEQRRADAELRRQSGLLAKLLATTADGAWRVDKQGHVLDVNEAYARMSGYTAKELLTMQLTDLNVGETPDQTVRHLQEIERTGFDRFETQHKTKDGRILDVEISASYCAEAGQVLSFVRDITERKLQDRRREQELRAMGWVGRIREALDSDRLVLYAQPIIDLNTRETVSHELLIRMIAADGSIVAPGEFLPAAERFGLIDEIDRWVVRQAAQIAARGFPVNFNLSGASLGQRDLIQTIERLLADAGAHPALLTCEITETALATEQALAEAFVHQLAALGCRIALDDFGTGYGGFTYLRRLPVDCVKIDVAFVRDLAESAESQHVVAAIVSLAKGFNKHTIAEGVEDPDTLDLLDEYNVDYAQGFAIGRPRPTADIFGP